jgi:hypothetical protein
MAAMTRTRACLLVAAAVALVAATACSSGSTTTSAPTPPTTAKAAVQKCVPGPAKGSCNTDEAAELAIPDKPLDAKTQALLNAQLAAARKAALQYPTVADAQKAGMILTGGFGPLVGAHYIDVRHVMGGFDPAHPPTYIYDGTSPTSKVIGLMYLGNGVLPPEGFAGPNDHWHRHSNACTKFAHGMIVVPFPVDSDVTKAQCDAVGGMFMRRTTWMVHAWVVPGHASPLGVFSHENPDVLCADGTTHTDAIGACKGT